METFQYEPLPIGQGEWIRLFELHCGQGSEKIECSITQVNLANNPQYEAISYCWGDPSITSPISFKDGLICVTKNLHSALIAMRRKEDSRMLWADAVCINQSDIDERNAQVAIMGSIYEKAQQILVWLGEESENSKKGIDLMKKIVEASGEEFSEDESIPLNPNLQELSDRVGITPLIGESVEAFYTIVRRPWFKRVWVVQEVAMSKSSLVHCGAETFPWRNILHTLRFLRTVMLLPHRSGIYVNYPFSIDSSRRSLVAGSETRLLSVLFRHRICLASDMRDKVYGLYGILRSLAFSPDYRLSVERVYVQIAVAIITQDRNLDILSIPKARAETNLSTKSPRLLPSWAPDWAVGDLCTPFSLRGDFDQHALPYEFEAAGLSSKWSSEIKVSKVDNILTVSGYVMDDIKECGRFFGMEDLAETSLEKVTRKSYINDILHAMDVDLEWRELARINSRKVYATGEDMSDVFLQTILAGLMPEGYEATKRQYELVQKGDRIILLAHKYLRRLGWINYAFHSILEMVFQIINFAKAALRGFRSVVRDGLHGSFLRIRSQMCMHRRLIITGNGFIGLAPYFAQVGDQIALVKGSKAPLVLRSRGTLWEVVGDSYIHGIMYGGAFEEQRCGDLHII